MGRVPSKTASLCRFCALVVLLANASVASSDRSASPKFPTPAQYQKMLGKGLDVDWSKTNRGRQSYTSSAVVAFKAAGLSHVRIRVKDPVTPALLTPLDAQVRDCVSDGIVPIIAYQADSFKRDPSDSNFNGVVAWWRAMAEHFRDEDPKLSFDLPDRAES